MCISFCCVPFPSLFILPLFLDFYSSCTPSSIPAFHSSFPPPPLGSIFNSLLHLSSVPPSLTFLYLVHFLLPPLPHSQLSSFPFLPYSKFPSSLSSPNMPPALSSLPILIPNPLPSLSSLIVNFLLPPFPLPTFHSPFPPSL